MGKVKVKTWWQGLSESTQNLAKTITAIGTIVGSLVIVANFIVNQVNASTNAKIDELSSEMKKADKSQVLSTTRLELLYLMQNDPENVVEIEKVARYYFVDLGGDMYMTGLYSKWAVQHNAQTYFHD